MNHREILLPLMVILLSYASLNYARNKFSKESAPSKYDTLVPPGKKYPNGVPCTIYDLKIMDCGIEVSRLGNKRIRLSYRKTCNLRNVTFIFHFGFDAIYSASITKHKHVVTVNEMEKLLEEYGKQFRTGRHYISAEMHATSMKHVNMKLESNKCSFYVIPENPTPNLGRLNRNVMAGLEFIVDASKSRNNELQQNDVGLEYRWSCVDDTDYCQGRYFGPVNSVTVSARYAIIGAKFNFTVEVKTATSEWQKAIQYIKVNPTRPFAINCIERCGKDPNKLNPLKGGMLIAECQFDCDRYDIMVIHGVIKILDGKRKDILLPRIARGPKIVKFMPANSRLKVIAYNNKIEQDIVGEQEFETYAIPKLENCKAIPPKGNPLTKFKIQCNYDEDQVEKFEVQVKGDHTVVFSTTSKYLDTIEFKIPGNSIATVTLTDINDMVISQKIIVQGEPLVEGIYNSTAMIDHLMDVLDGKAAGSLNVDDSIAAGNYSLAVQIIDVVARELSKMTVENEEDRRMTRMLRKRLLKGLSKLPIENIAMSLSVSGVVSLISTHNKDKEADSDMTKELSKMCSQVAKRQLYLMENIVQEDIKQKDLVDVTKNLLNCGEQEIVPYYEIFNKTAVDIEITTEFPIQDGLSENDIEEYPEYVADDLIEDEMSNFLYAAENVMTICRDLGKSLIISISRYNELPTYIERKGITIGVFKSTGVKVAGTIFHQHDVTVRVSPFVRNMPSLLAVQLCTYQKDPFWSTVKTFTIDTNVLELSITDVDEEREVTQFGNEPVNISLGVFTNKNVKISGVVNFLNSTISKYPEDNFTIFKIQAKSLEAFFIEFYDIGESDEIEAVFAEMERPQLHHFSTAKSITKNNSRLLIKHHSIGDKWFVLGMKPKQIQISSLKFSVYSVRCVTWNFTSSSWKIACPVHDTTTPEMIHCDCTHLSVLAGSFRYNDIKLHPKFIEIDFTLIKRGSLLIPTIVCITVGIYFLVLVYAIQKRETKEDAVFFLSDVHLHDRYSYLISILTGEKVDAGTTSEIMIQIFGTEGKSQEHVLNFPDPFLELLQSNQTDLFVLATSSYLGKLVKIHLWFDCSGSSPNWYCREIRICDLQTREWSLFKVKKWLRVDGKPRLFLEVAISSNQTRTGPQSRLKQILANISLRSLSNSIWSPSASAYNPSFGFPKKVTLILSVILTLMGVLLLFYGKPENLPRDSITANCYYEFNWITIAIALYSAVITFFPHIALIEGFKNSRLQFDDETSEEAKKLPFILTLVIWGVLIMNIIIQIHFLLIYGYWFIAPTAWQWLTSLLIALIFYIFVLDYILQILLISFGAIIENGKIDYEKITMNVELQREYLYSYFGKHICRPILTPLYGVIKHSDYLRKHLYFLQKREVLWQIQDFLMIIAFLSFLYVIIMEEKNTIYDVLAHHETLRLVKGRDNIRLRLEKVNKINEFETYMQHTLIPGLQSYQWYGRYLSKSPGLTTDACNRYLGIIRVRQHRVEDSQCDVNRLMNFINRTCRSSGYFPHLSFLNFTPAWTEAIPEFYRSRLGYVWGYQYATGESYFGVSGFYKKGGYVALLGRTKKNSFVNLEYLKRYYWMDILTRIIFIEFPFYNVNTNLFNFATVVLEKTPAGYIHKHASIKSTRIVKGTSHATTISVICSVLFIGLIILITVRTMLRIIRTKEWYTRDLWHVVDIGIISLSITYIVIYIKRLALMKYFVKELEEKQSNVFLDYFDMLGVESWMKILASSLICAITVRIWRLLRFASVFRIVERTLVYSFKSIMYLFAYFFICSIGFGFMGFILFCTTSDQFKDSVSTVKTLILMTIGVRGPNTLHLDERTSGLSYSFIVLFYMFTYVFTTILVAIIIVNFMKAQEYSFEESMEYNIKDYTHETIDNVKRLARMWVRKFRLTAGEESLEEEEMVTPKKDDVRYMNCVSVDSNRMKAMASVAKCVLLKIKKGLLTDESDHAIMMETVLNLSSRENGENEIFFQHATRSEGCMFVDNRRLLVIEALVKLMLEAPEKRAQRLQKFEEQESLRAENLAKLEMINYRLKTMVKAVKDIQFRLASR